MKREPFTTSILRLLVVLFALVTTTTAQVPTSTPTPVPSAAVPAVTLVSISALSGDTPKVVFTFDSDVTPYVASTYKLVSFSRGLATPSTALAVFNTNSPKTLAVPLDFASLSSADSVQVSVILADNSRQVFTAPFYQLDLSFLKAVKGYQDQIVSLANDKLTLTTDKQVLAGLYAKCQVDQASIISKSRPRQFDFQGSELVGPTVAILHFQTDKYTTIEVKDTANERNVFRSVGLDHHVKLSGLAPGTDYVFRAILADLPPQPAPAKSTRQNQAKPPSQPQQQDPSNDVKIIPIKTPNSVSFAPQLVLSSSSPTSITATVNFDPTGAHPTLKGYITLHYRQVVDEKTGLYTQPTDVGDGGIDSIGMPKGTAYTGLHDFVIAVAPGKQYNVTYTAYDEYGEVANSPQPGFFAKTDNLPDPLGFKGPIALSMNADTGLTVTWSANRPIKTAELSAKFPDGTIVLSPIKKDTTSTEVSVSTDLSGLETLLEKSAKSKEAPILTVSMSDGTNGPAGSATVSMSVTFVVSKSTGNEPPQKAATQVATAAGQKNGRVDWKTLIATGLGVLVKVL